MSSEANPVKLDGLAREIKAHWKAHRPQMYAALEQSGELDRSAQAASDRTGDALGRLIEEGMDYDKAWELVREEWAFLPAEPRPEPREEEEPEEETPESTQAT